MKSVPAGRVLGVGWIGVCVRVRVCVGVREGVGVCDLFFGGWLL